MSEQFCTHHNLLIHRKYAVFAKRSVRIAACLCLLTTLSAVTLIGCGGGGSGTTTEASTSGTDGTTQPVETGRLAIRFEWPELPTDQVTPTRAIPRFTRVLRVRVQQINKDNNWQDIATESRSRPDSVTSSQEFIQFENIPKITGSIRLVAEAFASDPTVSTVGANTSNLLGSVEYELQKNDDFSKTIRLTLESPVKSLIVSSNDITVNVGESKIFTVTPKDSNGDLVLLDPNTELDIVDANSISAKTFNEYFAVDRVNATSRDFRVTGRRRVPSVTPPKIAVALTDKVFLKSADSVTPVQVQVNVKTRVEFYDVEVGVSAVSTTNPRMPLGSTLYFKVRGDSNVDSDQEFPKFAVTVEDSSIPTPLNVDKLEGPLTEDDRPNRRLGPNEYLYKFKSRRANTSTNPFAITATETEDNNRSVKQIPIIVDGTPRVTGQTTAFGGSSQTYSFELGTEPITSADNVVLYYRSGMSGDYTPMRDYDSSYTGDKLIAKNNVFGSADFRVPFDDTNDQKFTIIGVTGRSRNPATNAYDLLTSSVAQSLIDNKQAALIVVDVPKVAFDIIPGGIDSSSAEEVKQRLTDFDLHSLVIKNAVYSDPVIDWSIGSGLGSISPTRSNKATFKAEDYSLSPNPVTGIQAKITLTPSWGGAPTTTFTKTEYIKVLSGSLTGKIQ